MTGLFKPKSSKPKPTPTPAPTQTPQANGAMIGASSQQNYGGSTLSNTNPINRGTFLQ